jgi:AcrR family transcriptional regulator
MSQTKSPPAPPTTLPPESKRRPGRPPRISRRAIIDKSMEILATTHANDFQLKTVAGELGTGSMAIYNYFASRDDLLKAVAEEVCLLFQPPQPRGTWQETLLAWLWAIKRHADRYPLMPDIIGLNGNTCPGWIRLVAPVTVLMHEELGLRGKPLALATYLFGSTASMMIYVVTENRGRQAIDALPNLDELDLDERQRRILKKTPLAALKEDEILDALFAQLIRGIELFL